MLKLFIMLALISLICSSTQGSGIKKLKDIIIYQDPNFYSAFPSIIARNNGAIICAFRRAPDRRALWQAPRNIHCDPNSYLMLVRSNDGGETWSKEPELIYAHPLGGSQDPCMVQLSDGSIVCTSYAWSLIPPEGEEKLKDIRHHSLFYFLGGYVLRSDDGSKTWKGPFVPIAVPGDLEKDALNKPCPAFNRGAIAQGKDGKLYWAVCASRKVAQLLTSVDRGETWQYVCPIAQDEKVAFTETSLIETKKGDIVAFIRTLEFDGKLAYARSTDGGKSFGQWKDGGFYGFPSHAIHLKDGRVLLVYGYRNAPFGIRGKILNAECTDIETAPEFIVREDGGNGDLGYPWAVQLADGKVLVAYYFNLQDGTRHIAGSLLEVQ